MVINWVDAKLYIIPISDWTMNEKGKKQVEISGLGDKRQITAIFAGTLKGMKRATKAKNYKNYPPESLDKAFKLYLEGDTPLTNAAKLYGIPRATLDEYVKDRYAAYEEGSELILTEDEELQIAQWVVQMTCLGFSITRHQLFQIIKNMIVNDGRKFPFKENGPGKRWLADFIKRHPEISEKAPIKCRAKSKVITPAEIQCWHKKLRDYVTDQVEDPDIMNDPSRLFTADVLGFPLCSKTGNLLILNMDENSYYLTCGINTQITVQACVSAEGYFIQPLIVFPEESLDTNVLKGFEEAAINWSENGWMDSDLFVIWLKEVFIPDIEQRNITRPVMLFVNSKTTHMTPEASDICEENGIHIFCFLQNNLNQPLGNDIFNVIKEEWNKAMRSYTKENFPNTVTIKTYAQVFKSVWEKSAIATVATKAFEDAGLFPLKVSLKYCNS